MMPSTNREAFGRRMTSIWQASCRRKTGNYAERTRRATRNQHRRRNMSQPDVDRSPSDDHPSTPWELGATVIVTSLPVAVFVVAGEKAVATAGPSAMCSVMLVTAACGLAAYCQSNLPSRHQRYLYSSVGGPYELLYRMCGEAIGYLVGWLLILHHCSFAALVARSVGLYADSLVSGTMTSNGSRTPASATAPAAAEAVLQLIANTSLASTDATMATTIAATQSSSVTVDATGYGGRPDVVTAVVSLLVIAAAVTSSALAEAASFRDVVWKLFRRESRSSLMQSLATGNAATVCALVIGLVIFAAAVSMTHGFHFTNWKGHEGFFAGGMSGILASTATFYFLFNTYGDVIRRTKSVQFVPKTTDVSRRSGSTTSASATSASVSASIVAIIATSSICVIALTTLTPPAVAPSSPSSNQTMVLSGHQATSFADSYTVANLVWMKRTVCAVATLSLVPGAMFEIRSTAVIINKMMSDGLLPSLFVGSPDPANNSPAILVAISVGVVVTTLTLVCSPEMLLGLVSIASLAIDSMTVGTILDAIYRPLETTIRRRRRPRSSNRKLQKSPRSLSPPLEHCNSALLSTEASASSILNETNLSPMEDRFMFDDAAASSESDVITECPTLSTGNGDSESSSSWSSDADIDDVFDDFQQTRLNVLAHCRQDDALIDVRCPDENSHRRAVRALVAFIVAIVVTSVVLAHAQSWLSSSGVKSAASVGGLVLGIVMSLTAVGYGCFLPRNDDVLSMTSPGLAGPKSTMRVRCAALASIGVNWSLMMLVELMSYVVVVAWFLIGIILYATYGMRHSNENHSRYDLVAEEHRTLLSIEHHAPDVTSNACLMATDAQLSLSCGAVVSGQRIDHTAAQLCV